MTPFKRQFLADRRRRYGSQDGTATPPISGIPTPIRHAQRRRNFRVTLDQGAHLGIRTAFNGEIVHGEACDLSTTGIGGYLRTRKLPTPGKGLSLCLLLPGGQTLTLPAEIRYARRQPGRQCLHIGARFAAVTGGQERQIARFLAAQQRKRRRFDPR